MYTDTFCVIFLVSDSILTQKTTKEGNCSVYIVPYTSNGRARARGFPGEMPCLHSTKFRLRVGLSER